MTGAMPEGATIFAGPVSRLVEAGQRRGRLSVEDLRRELPVHAMTPEELAIVVTRLEDAGIAVEIDESLLRPAPGLHALPLPPEGEAAPPLSNRSSVHAGDAVGAQPHTATAVRPPNSNESNFTAHVAVAVAAAISLGLLFVYFVGAGG